MRKAILLLLTSAVITLGCFKSTGPGETKTFYIASGVYASCGQRSADSQCRKRGYTRAVSYDCERRWIVGFMGAHEEMNIITCVTCWREK